MIKSEHITVTAVNHHRNGVGGVPFYAVNFTDAEEGEMFAVVFAPYGEDDEPDWHVYEHTPAHNPQVAVFHAATLPNLKFGENSWRGDRYAPHLYAAIANREQGVA